MLKRACLTGAFVERATARNYSVPTRSKRNNVLTSVKRWLLGILMLFLRRGKKRQSKFLRCRAAKEEAARF